jgi:hypothetical protein
MYAKNTSNPLFVQIIYMGRVASVAYHTDQLEHEDWQAVVLTQFPSCSSSRTELSHHQEELLRLALTTQEQGLGIFKYSIFSTVVVFCVCTGVIHVCIGVYVSSICACACVYVHVSFVRACVCMRALCMLLCGRSGWIHSLVLTAHAAQPSRQLCCAHTYGPWKGQTPFFNSCLSWYRWLGIFLLLCCEFRTSFGFQFVYRV